VTLTDAQIAAEIRRSEIPENVIHLLALLEQFGTDEIPEGLSSESEAVGRVGRGHDEMKDALKRRDAALSSHRAVDSGAEWNEVPATLPERANRKHRV